MTDRPTPADEQLADSLLAEETRSRGAGAGSNALLQKVVDQELASERRVRRAAIAAWSLELVLLALFASAMVAGPVAGRAWHWVATGLYFGVPVLSFLTLIVAVLTTAAWLFRPRAASLAIIERRLAALEDLLLRRG